MSNLKSNELQAKLDRVKELVELLENYEEGGFRLKLDLMGKTNLSESGLEESSRVQYDIFKYN